MNQVGSLLLQKMECEVHCQQEAYLCTKPKSTVYSLSSLSNLSSSMTNLFHHIIIVTHNVFRPSVASFFQKYESDMNFVLIEICSFQQPVSYLLGLDPKSFRISLAFNMVTRISGCCFRSLWSGNWRGQ